MSDERTSPAPTIWPCVSAHDAKALIRVLTASLGFEATVVHAEGDVVQHAELSWPPGGGLMLGSVREESVQYVAAPGTLTAYAVTDEPDPLYARARAAGATIVKDLHDTDYGSRDFAIRDPEGNYWQFGTYRGEPRSAPRT